VKFLIALVVIITVVWLVRTARKDSPLDKKPPPPPQRPASQTVQGEPATMLECRHCGLHLPSDEAIQGQQGAYCTQAHRLLAEK
jgi:uncharacterized protein